MCRPDASVEQITRHEANATLVQEFKEYLDVWRRDLLRRSPGVRLVVLSTAWQTPPPLRTSGAPQMKESAAAGAETGIGAAGPWPPALMLRDPQIQKGACMG